MFTAFSPEDKARYVELMLQQPSLVQAGITREEVLKAYHEIEANTQAINRITADPLFVIMTRLDPRSVLRACETTSQFRRLCNNPNLFSALLRVHYPNNFETNNPKEQYIAITMGLETYYRVPIEVELDENDIIKLVFVGAPVQIGKTKLPHHIPDFKVHLDDPASLDILLGPGYVPPILQPLLELEAYERMMYQVQHHATEFQFSPQEAEELYRAGKLTDEVQLLPAEYQPEPGVSVVFKVKGYRIPPGNHGWLYVLEDPYSPSENKTIFFKTKGALVEYFMDDEYMLFAQTAINEFFQLQPDYDEQQVDWNVDIDEIFKRLDASTPEWKFYLQRLGLPQPLNRLTTRKHLLLEETVALNFDAESESWLFPKVNF
ncbi:MAG: hypothetical protein H0X02_12945 [Nitrosomonas sp.]|nr:hypothetical protein [Nitrosomonas sp.]